MDAGHQIIYSDTAFKIISIEQEFIIHPVALCLLPLTKASMKCSYSLALHIDEYHLFLDKLILHNADNNEKLYEFDHCMISYSGAILIGTNMLKEYSLKGNKPACFSYQNVIELVFEDGVLITAIDQNKAMLRIRKNLELSLRSLTSKRDIRCIRRFMNSAFVGDYKTFKLPGSCMNYLRDMKKNYEKENIIIKS